MMSKDEPCSVFQFYLPFRPPRLGTELFAGLQPSLSGTTRGSVPHETPPPSITPPDIVAPGTALAPLMPTGPIRVITRQCLDDMGASVGHLGVYTDEEIEVYLEPVKELVSTVVSCAARVNLQPSYAANTVDLTQRVQESLMRLDVSITRASILRLLRTFLPELDQETPAVIQAQKGEQIDRQVTRVRHGIEEFLRRWTTTFPAPTNGVWPDDFDSTERRQIRLFIDDFVKDASRNLLADSVTEDAIERTVEDIMGSSDFPVAKGHGKGVVQQVVKLLRAEKLRPRRKRKSANVVEGDSEEVLLGTVSSTM